MTPCAGCGTTSRPTKAYDFLGRKTWYCAQCSRGLEHSPWVPQKMAWVVKRMYSGSWQYWAGVNEALGAHRWEEDPRAAVVFNDRSSAGLVAYQHSAFVTPKPR